MWLRTSSMSIEVAYKASTEETPVPALKTESGTQEQNLSLRWARRTEAQSRWTTGKTHKGRCPRRCYRLTPLESSQYTHQGVPEATYQQLQFAEEPRQDLQTKKKKRALIFIPSPSIKTSSGGFLSHGSFVKLLTSKNGKI